MVSTENMYIPAVAADATVMTVIAADAKAVAASTETTADAAVISIIEPRSSRG